MMKSLLNVTAVAAVLAAPGVALAHSHVAAEASKVVHVTFIDTNGQALGLGGISQTSGGVLIDLDLKGLAAGEKAFHIHEKGVCNPADKFASAGGHFAPAKNPHGLLVEHGPHAGDMPNQFVGEDGRLRAQVLNGTVTLAEGDAGLADADGSALVIHAGPDDYKSQPAGDAGGRVACAVIFAPKS